MKSPFPGMDPFIEARGLWTDFHDNLIVELRRALNSLLPGRYEALIGERTYIDVVETVEGTRTESVIKPDVRIDGRLGAATGNQQANESLVLTAPLLMHGEFEAEERESFIEVRDAENGDRVVTCIEVLSPTNKRLGTLGWSEYERKRQWMLQGAANFVEIDLLRCGRRPRMREPWPKSPYYVLVMRQEEAPACQVFPAFISTRLPSIPVPLLASDADHLCDLQVAVNAVFETSRYERRLRYGEPIDPPLSPAERQFLPNSN